MVRLYCITAAKWTSIFTDNANLVYIFDPIGMNPGIARHTARELTRWNLKLNYFRFIIAHVFIEDNIWSEILKKWTVQRRHQIAVLIIGRVKSLMIYPISSARQVEIEMAHLKYL